MPQHSVTIGLTCFNAENSIRAALDSAFAQTLPAKQIVAVDDCSTDATSGILSEYADRPGFEWTQNPVNRGVAASRNEIIRRATGEFLLFFDDDDVSEPTRVEKQVHRIRGYEAHFARGSPVICHTERTQVFPDGSSRREKTFGVQANRPAPSGEAIVRYSLMGEPIADAQGSYATCSQAARTQTYRELGGFDEDFRRCEDTEFGIRAALASAHFVGIDEPLVVQNMSVSSAKNLAQHEKYTLMMLDKHREYLEAKGIYSFCRDWTALKFQWLASRKAAFAGTALKLGVRHPVLTWRRARMSFPDLDQFRLIRK